MIARRDFITLLGGAAAWPLAAGAQSSSGRPLIGVLSPSSPAAATRNIEALQAGLRDLGYVEGHNVTSVLRFAGGVPARLPELAAELAALKPDVIIAGSVSGILAARAATRTIPLIFFVIEDPVAMGLVSSITRQRRNVAIEYRWAEGHFDRLPALAADLVDRKVAVIVMPFSLDATRAAKAATTTIPVIFTTGLDPVQVNGQGG